MNLLRMAVGLAAGVGLFMLFAVLAWYIVIPLFFIVVIFAAFQWVRAKFTEEKLQVFDMPSPLEDEKPRKKVIDVDYTEI